MYRNRFASTVFLVFALVLTMAFPAVVSALSQQPLDAGFVQGVNAIQTTQATQSGETTYPWPMNGHDYQRTFYTDSPAPSTANLLWKAQMNDTPSFGPVVAEGKVFQGTVNTGDVYAWDANSGKLLWTRNLNNSVQGVTYFNGKIYCAGGTLPHDSFTRDTGDLWVCLDAKTGNTIWTYQIPQRLMFIPEQVGSVHSELTVYENKAYVRVKDGYVILNPDTGEVISEWLDGYGDFSRCPSFYEGDIFGIYNYTQVYRADTQTQEIKWISPPLFASQIDAINDIWGYMLVSLSSDQAYVPGDLAGGQSGRTTQNSIYQIDAVNGNVGWKFLAGGQVDSIAVAYNRLFCGATDGYVYCLDKFVEYAPYWKFKTDGAILEDPAVADGKIYFGSFDSYVYCLNVTNGDLIWKYRAEGPVTGNAAVADGNLYISSNDKYIYCFGSPPPRQESKITLSTPSRITIGESVLMSGTLTNQSGVGVGSANVTVSYRVFPITEWTDINTVTTASDGKYAYTWTPPYEGYYYEFNASYSGGSYEPSSAKSIVKVSAQPEIPQYLIFVSVTGAIASVVAAIFIIGFWYTNIRNRRRRIWNRK
jgi:outer membrane protein assembly factor BamB